MTTPLAIDGNFDGFFPWYWWLWACACSSVPVLALLTVVLGVIRADLRAHRVAPPDVTLCPRCGYDLRATPDRCPECRQEPPTTLQVRP